MLTSITVNFMDAFFFFQKYCKNISLRGGNCQENGKKSLEKFGGLEKNAIFGISGHTESSLDRQKARL